jgi:prepilin-type N-terminal cleavage/methylation domain-containing protein
VFAWMSRAVRKREGGFTLIELVVVLAIIGILLALAVPRYLGARKKAYGAEANNILEEIKTLEWSYFQEYNTFSSSVSAIGLTMPSFAHWATPALTTSATNVTILTSGTTAPVAATDEVSLILATDGSATAGQTF